MIMPLMTSAILHSSLRKLERYRTVDEATLANGPRVVLGVTWRYAHGHGEGILGKMSRHLVSRTKT